MPHSYDYAVLRVVPRVERGEFVNAGVIVFCRTLHYLDAAVSLDAERVRSLCPNADLPELEEQLAMIARICRGTPDAGPVGRLSLAERFHWLVAPRSTIIQTSPVHCGLCEDPGTVLTDLMERLVRRPCLDDAPAQGQAPQRRQ
jgi:hypothetical protein